MKKRVILLLMPFLLGCKSQSNSGAQFKHVVIFGVDGAGGEFENIDTPNFDRIFGSGSINYHGVAQSPTISAQNWGSMIYGVSASTHKKTNSYIASNKHTDENLPSFIKTYATNHKKATYFSAVNWSPINFGLFEDVENLTKVNGSEVYEGLSSEDIDQKVADSVVERLKERKDRVVFTQFDSVDHAGHSYGPESDKYINAIKNIDRLIGQIYDAYASKNLLKSTLFMCVSDHGHKPNGGHGGDSEKEKSTMIAVNGGRKKIIQGCCESYTTADVATIVLHALNEPLPSHYEGKVPNNMFLK